MLRYLASSLLLLSGCSDPIGPSPSPAQVLSGRPLISFERLGAGDTLVVDQHSIGCFVTSDAHLIFVGTEDGAVVSGVLNVNSRASTIPIRHVTPLELAGLENLHQLYRREEHQTRCMSTGHHSTTFRKTSGASEHYDTDGCIEMEFVTEGPSFTMRPRPGIGSLYEFTKPGYDAILHRP
jgi:hypothetical protein